MAYLLAVWGGRFQSYTLKLMTLPRGGSDPDNGEQVRLQDISIHAPRGGSDQVMQPYTRAEEFQSTLPVGGATINNSLSIMGEEISIHAPRGGSDSEATVWCR